MTTAIARLLRLLKLVSDGGEMTALKVREQEAEIARLTAELAEAEEERGDALNEVSRLTGELNRNHVTEKMP